VESQLDELHQRVRTIVRRNGAPFSQALFRRGLELPTGKLARRHQLRIRRAVVENYVLMLTDEDKIIVSSTESDDAFHYDEGDQLPITWIMATKIAEHLLPLLRRLMVLDDLADA
jgi:hypothetical protein